MKKSKSKKINYLKYCKTNLKNPKKKTAHMKKPKNKYNPHLKFSISTPKPFNHTQRKQSNALNPTSTRQNGSQLEAQAKNTKSQKSKTTLSASNKKNHLILPSMKNALSF